ncbi:methyltransferase domain-containing protein [Mycolicibacterium novocastrense]|uniref:Methyltransferase domain-containing protein n=1 Tax=Mycolicibacterium novocastrense TaxID=59813 RepID=A0AAW5STM2_MYCNV|nr:methyltransferase domain-containing protein [Mycolicibacterium novocastrense]MCV7026927.1 methyltransferase domain-containing protein [Mycolicibacterium novocastrense]GAT08629.1 methyltransferase type 11 [Mycolicibacterium novocastrense]
MTDASSLPPALRRAVELFAEPPTRLDLRDGYLDLLDDAASPNQAPPENKGLIQAVWASGPGSMFYDYAQGFARRFVGAWQLPIEWLDIPKGGVALDIGSGPGNVTASLARAAGSDGLALGIDISRPMLARAVSAQAGPNVGFLRADAQRLPFRDATVDAVTSLAVVQLIPEPASAVAEMHRVLRPGGRIAIMVPTVGSVPPPLRWLSRGGARFFAEDELGDLFEQRGFERVRTKTIGNMQWVRAQHP